VEQVGSLAMGLTQLPGFEMLMIEGSTAEPSVATATAAVVVIAVVVISAALMSLFGIAHARPLTRLDLLVAKLCLDSSGSRQTKVTSVRTDDS